MIQTQSKYKQKNTLFVSLTSPGKERDSETGFSYFGARYYDSDILTSWLSVDPMADKYPSLSPYNYCAWNPIRLVDPDGRKMNEPPFDLKYCIQKGDNLWNLENEWNIPHGTLQRINPSIDPQKLQIGQEINVAKMTGGIMIVGNDVQIPEGQELKIPDEEGFTNMVSMNSGDDFLFFRMAFEALSPYMGSFLLGKGLKSTRTISNVDKILNRAKNGTGMYGLGKATYAEAMEAGKKWVGKGFRTSQREGSSILISADGKRQFRIPKYKEKLNKYQANFESRNSNSGQWSNNGHLNIE